MSRDDNDNNEIVYRAYLCFSREVIWVARSQYVSFLHRVCYYYVFHIIIRKWGEINSQLISVQRHRFGIFFCNFKFHYMLLQWSKLKKPPKTKTRNRSLAVLKCWNIISFLFFVFWVFHNHWSEFLIQIGIGFH